MIDAYNSILKNRGKKGIKAKATKMGLDHKVFPHSRELLITSEIETLDPEVFVPKSIPTDMCLWPGCYCRGTSEEDRVNHITIHNDPRTSFTAIQKIRTRKNAEVLPCCGELLSTCMQKAYYIDIHKHWLESRGLSAQSNKEDPGYNKTLLQHMGWNRRWHRCQNQIGTHKLGLAKGLHWWVLFFINLKKISQSLSRILSQDCVMYLIFVMNMNV